MQDLDQLTEMLTQTSQEDLDAILQRVEEIKASRKAEQELKSQWPKRTVLYVHRDKESNYDMQEELGLSDDAMQNQFRGAGYEVGLVCDVLEDGRCLMIGVEGPDNQLFELNEPVEI